VRVTGGQDRFLAVVLTPAERDVLVKALYEKMKRDTADERDVLQMLVNALEAGELEALHEDGEPT
jgi:hypothetical protein